MGAWGKAPAEGFGTSPMLESEGLFGSEGRSLLGYWILGIDGERGGDVVVSFSPRTELMGDDANLCYRRLSVGGG